MALKVGSLTSIQAVQQRQDEQEKQVNESIDAVKETKSEDEEEEDELESEVEEPVKVEKQPRKAKETVAQVKEPAPVKFNVKLNSKPPAREASMRQARASRRSANTSQPSPVVREEKSARSSARIRDAPRRTYVEPESDPEQDGEEDEAQREEQEEDEVVEDQDEEDDENGMDVEDSEAMFSSDEVPSMPVRLTARQAMMARVANNELDGTSYESTPVDPSPASPIDEAHLDARRADAEHLAAKKRESAKRRKIQADAKLEIEKYQTINRLLKKKAPVERPENGVQTGSGGVDVKKEEKLPTMMRWVSNAQGCVLHVPSQGGFEEMIKTFEVKAR